METILNTYYNKFFYAKLFIVLISLFAPFLKISEFFIQGFHSRLREGHGITDLCMRLNLSYYAIIKICSPIKKYR